MSSADSEWPEFDADDEDEEWFRDSPDYQAEPAAPSAGGYEVGYCKPPRETQFKKGQSGNPAGRPRKQTDFMLDPLERMLSKRMPVTIAGRRRQVPIGQAVAMQTVQLALKGDAQARKECLGAARSRARKEGARREAKEELPEQTLRLLIEAAFELSDLEILMLDLGLLFRHTDEKLYVNRAWLKGMLAECGLPENYSLGVGLALSTPDIEAEGISPQERTPLHRFTKALAEHQAKVDALSE